MFDNEGAVSGDTRDFLQGWMDKYVAWVKRHAH
jgi:chromate reductase, NAD(P)H dehydrogenase (quinone)